jgi:predicted ATP-dependent serine protease
MDRRDFLNLSAALPYPMFFSGDTPAEEKPLEYFSTGFPTLDIWMKGGIRPGELCFVYGTSGSGKTAFCNKMAKTYEAWDIKHPVKGSNDLLMLGNDNISKSLFSNYFCEEFSQGNWKTKYEFVKEMKEFAAEMNIAIIWTFPIIRIPVGNDKEKCIAHESYVSSVDYLISIDNSTVWRKLNLLKNRHGKCGEISTYITIANNKAMLNELC